MIDVPLSHQNSHESAPRFTPLTPDFTLPHDGVPNFTEDMVGLGQLNFGLAKYAAVFVGDVRLPNSTYILLANAPHISPDRRN